MPDDGIVRDRHILKSLKFSTIVVAQSMGNNILQHFLARREHVAVHGFTDTFAKSGEHEIMAKDLLNRLLPFARFRNMLVHQYWRLEDGLFIENLSAGLSDFRLFIREVRRIAGEWPLEN